MMLHPMWVANNGRTGIPMLGGYVQQLTWRFLAGFIRVRRPMRGDGGKGLPEMEGKIRLENGVCEESCLPRDDCEDVCVST